MQEVTSVLTVSITAITQASEEEASNIVKNLNKKEAVRLLENALSNAINADNVKIENVQHFIMDK